MKALIVLMCMFVVSCGSGGGDFQPEHLPNHGYGNTHDVTGATGLQLRYAGMAVAGDLLADPTYYETRIAAVSACSGLPIPAANPAFVIVVYADALGVGPNGPPGKDRFVLYQSDPPLILLDILSPDTAMRHGALHYLLDVNTGNQDVGHTSPLWSCVS